MVAEEFYEALAVVLVDGFEGHTGGVEGLHEVVVGDAPGLGEGGPGDECGGGAGGAGEGGGGGVEGFVGRGTEVVRYGGAPVDDGAEDVCEEGFGWVGEGHDGSECAQDEEWARGLDGAKSEEELDIEDRGGRYVNENLERAA